MSVEQSQFAVNQLDKDIANLDRRQNGYEYNKHDFT
ncbi:hypothetical protein DFR58_12937 [Anaerobacterium chartisolvens]|uniref:Uncharacterized protein n=1 Tax=Anaerobacterium chartisolvens TaxID=1297424 RepID=A0A369AN01_9FIRM|nr:hypothetical protein DFR58_12937 [Anaerobacterium chartisolvens]